MAEAQSRGGGRVKLLFIMIVVVACLGVIAYLAGQLNVHRYYLVLAERELVVHRGAPIPFVTKPYAPQTEADRVAYAPIRVPARWNGPRRESYGDRAALDRAIFALMQERLRNEFYSGRLPNLERVDAAMERVAQLAGLTDDDRRQLEELRGDYSYLKAREIIEGLPVRLNEARRLCDEAEQLGTGKLGDPKQLSRRLGQWMQLIANSAVAQPLPPAQTPAVAAPLFPEVAPPTPATVPVPAPVPAAPGPIPAAPAPTDSTSGAAPTPATAVDGAPAAGADDPL